MRKIHDKPYYKEPWYPSYNAMMTRCYNKNAANYHNYGGNGITVCEEWKDVSKFALWAEDTFEKGKTLDRIDNSKGYSPNNCRWATKKEQGNNRRTCVIVEYNGESHNLTQWAEILGIPKGIIINKHNKGIEPPQLFEYHPVKGKDNFWHKGRTWVVENGKRRWV